jgi:hypothetical protein
VNTLMLRSVPWVIWPGKLNVVIVFVMPDFDVVCLVCRIILNDLDEPVFQKLFSPDWEKGLDDSNYIATAIATMKDYLQDFSHWLVEYFYCKLVYEMMSKFIVKLRTETSTSLDGVGSLILTSTECGLVNLRVTSVAQRLEGPRSYPPGSLVILGLARGWNGGSSGYFNPKRCYLMVIGIISPESQDTTDGAEVVKLSRKGGVVVQDCDVYIGRRVARGGWNLPSSKWHNPHVAKDSNPESVQEAVNLYEKYVRKSPSLMDSIEELRGKRLGCWCKTSPGAPCHGDVLVKLLNEAKVENYV